MTRGTSAKRRQTRTRSRQRSDAHSRIPKWNPTTKSEKQDEESASAHHAIAAAGGCQPCSNHAYCPKAEGVARRTSSESSIGEGEVVYGPWPRPRARSHSFDRYRHKSAAETSAKAAWQQHFAQTNRPKRRSWSDIPRCPDSSGSSSGPDPLSSPTASDESSTLSSESLAEIFPYDSDIFSSSPIRKEEDSQSTHGAVALRNPNTVALCSPPNVITNMPAKIALGIPGLSGSFGTTIPQNREVSEMMEALKNLAECSQTPDAIKALRKMGLCPKSITDKAELQKFLKLSDRQSDAVVPAKRHHSPEQDRQPEPEPLVAEETCPENPIETVGTATECNPLSVATHNLKFCCQLAHGSPTAIISNFTSVDQLFQSIADCFNISPDDIIFCTINTFKPDMDKLFAGALEYSDMLFAHVKGQAVEVEMTKSEELFGLTVSDNGRCRSFIKRMKENSVAARARPALAIGQLIEKIDGVNVTGMRHYEVVRILRNMPLGKTFTLRVVSPKQSGFQQIAPRSLMTHRMSINDGMRTLRFKANGNAVIEQKAVDKVMIGRLNDILDSYLGVQDDQLAQSLWDLALTCKTLPEMNQAVRESELKVFDFPEELVFDMWGVIGDWRRSQSKKEKKKSKKPNTDPLEDDQPQPLQALF